MRARILLLLTIMVFVLIPIKADACSCGDPYCTYECKTDAGAKKKVRKYIKDFLKRGKARKFRVKFIKPNKLTYEKLVNRKKDKIIYVEVVTGYVLNDDFDGVSREGYYISYNGIDSSLKPGSCIRSYCVYNPFNTYEDDIIFRTDRLVNRKSNTKQIKKAVRKFVKNFGYNPEVI